MAWKPGDILKMTAGLKKGWWFVKEAAASKVSGSGAYAALKPLGLAIRKQDFLNALKAVRYANLSKSMYMPADGTGLPNAQFIPRNPIKQKKKYSVIIDYDVDNLILGYTEKSNITLSSDSLWEVQDYLNDATEILLQGISDEPVLAYNIEIDKIRFHPSPTLG